MNRAKQIRALGSNYLSAALILGAAAGLPTGAFAQTAPVPATAGKPFRHELPVMDVPGTYKQAQGRYVEFPAGFKSPTAFHAGEEIGYVISGDYALTLDGQPRKELKGGDTFSIPRGIRHGFTTVNGAKLVAFWVVEKGLPLDLSPEK